MKIKSIVLIILSLHGRKSECLSKDFLTVDIIAGLKKIVFFKEILLN